MFRSLHTQLTLMLVALFLVIGVALVSIIATLAEKRPDYLFCAFDMPGKTFRHERYEQYKANRAEMPVDLVPQITAVSNVAEELRKDGVPLIADGGIRYSGDMAEWFARRGHEVTVITAPNRAAALHGRAATVWASQAEPTPVTITPMVSRFRTGAPTLASRLGSRDSPPSKRMIATPRWIRASSTPPSVGADPVGMGSKPSSPPRARLASWPGARLRPVPPGPAAAGRAGDFRRDPLASSCDGTDFGLLVTV